MAPDMDDDAVVSTWQPYPSLLSGPSVATGVAPCVLTGRRPVLEG